MFDPDAQYDVAVLGGGLCGFAAARALASSGARVALVERRPVLGWEATWAMRLALDSDTCSAAAWLRETATARGALRDGTVTAPVLEILLDEAADSLGIALLLYAQPVGIGRDGDHVTGVLLGTKAGEVPVRARAFVDATENAILWRLAGSTVRPPSVGNARHALLLSHCGDAVPAEEQALGDLAGVGDVRLRASVWPGELLVDFAIESCHAPAARAVLPDLLRGLREGMPALGAAVVSAVAVEPFPLGTARVEDLEGGKHARFRNLFAAGAWAASASSETGTLGGRLAIGEAAGDAIGPRLRELPLAPAGPLPHSRVAPPVHETDVLVCGGGTGGALAAIASAREGAATMLLEASNCLGGIGTGGGIHSYYHGVTGGLQDEVDQRVAEVAPLFGPAAGFHPEAKKCVLEAMAQEAGVSVHYTTSVTGAHAEGIPSALPATNASPEPPRRLTTVVAAGPDGNAIYQAKAFVDGTGDGDLAAMAGAAFTFGREADGLPHAYSLPAGRVSDEGKLLITNFDAGYVDPTDVIDLTRARRQGLAPYRKTLYEDANHLTYIAPILGLRNSRQVVGDARVTMADEIAGRQFPDVVAYAYSHFDNHGLDYENESDEAMLWTWLLGNWSRQFGCEVPYRALLPRGIEGLLMGCRALSLTHDAHNQLRMQRDLQRIGEVAGIAAAMAAARGVTPRDLPVSDLQERLLALGALGPRRRPELPAPEEDTLHDTSWVPAQPPALPLSDLAAQLGSHASQEATWQLVRSGEDALPVLLDAAGASQPTRRFWASVGLAMLHRPEAVPELLAVVQERREDTPEGRKTAPLWMGAAVLLGRLRDPKAVPVLGGVLTDPDAGLDALIGAARSLGRIGDPAGIPFVDALLAREDIPTERRLQVSGAGINPVVEDARWQLELAAAQALAAMGDPRPELARCYLHDDRALVRRHARRVLALSGG